MITFILIGSVDNGKSTCSGGLLSNMGVFSEHEIKKATIDAKNNKMERWKWAYLLDIDNRERIRGKTHEYNIINFKFNKKDYSLIDTPGHGHFIRNTIEALDKVSDTDGIGICILSAIENEFESGFERGIGKEQLILLRASNVRRLIIVMNKMDKVNYNNVNIESFIERVIEFIKPLNFIHIRFCYISAYENIGLDKLIENIDELGEYKLNNDYKDHEIYKMNKLRCNMYIYNTMDIICKGYTCILHTGGVEYEVEVKYIKSKIFVRSKERCIIVFKLDKEANIFYNQRVIIRNNDKTIGYGFIINKD